MFEKEAEERGNEKIKGNNDLARCSRKSYKDGFKEGAEFGYNKGFEFGVKSNEKVNQIVTNEWHYVKEGDLPKEDDVYLVYTTKGVLLGHYEQGGADGETNFKGEPYSDFTEYPSEMLFTEDEIIAWKEIVLPELKEIEC